MSREAKQPLLDAASAESYGAAEVANQRKRVRTFATNQWLQFLTPYSEKHRSEEGREVSVVIQGAAENAGRSDVKIATGVNIYPYLDLRDTHRMAAVCNATRQQVAEHVKTASYTQLSVAPLRSVNSNLFVSENFGYPWNRDLVQATGTAMQATVAIILKQPEKSSEDAKQLLELTKKQQSLSKYNKCCAKFGIAGYAILSLVMLAAFAVSIYYLAEGIKLTQYNEIGLSACGILIFGAMNIINCWQAKETVGGMFQMSQDVSFLGQFSRRLELISGYMPPALSGSSSDSKHAKKAVDNGDARDLVVSSVSVNAV